MISAVDVCKREINMRTVLAVAVISTSIGYLLGPAAALPRDCYAGLVKCEGQLSQAGYSKSTTESVCLSRQQLCWAENAREGYGINGEKPGGKKEANNNDPKGKKPKKEKEWKRPLPHIAGPSKSGLIGNIGNNAQLGSKPSTPTTTAPTATSVSTPAVKISPPKPAMVSTEAIARERRIGAGRF
jgi:hypothetical protein